MKYLKLFAIIGVSIVVIITLGGVNSQSLEEVCFSLKEIINDSNSEVSTEKTMANNNSPALSEPMTNQSVWDFVKTNKWYILIGGITIVGITAILYKYLSSENISGDNTDSSLENENISVNSISSYTAEASISKNSQIEEEEYEEIRCVLMGVPRDENDLSEYNHIKFVVPAFVEPHEFTTADVLVNTFRLDNGMKMFLKYVTLEMYTNFSQEEALRWLDAWETYHYNYKEINR